MPDLSPTAPDVTVPAAEHVDSRTPSNGARAWLRAAITFVVTVAAVLAAHQFVAANFSIPSGSMEPTLRPGDQILVDELTWKVGGLRRGDVVVFSGAGSWDPASSDRDYVKRVIGLPGDTVACCDTQGRVSVNGTALTEPYVTTGDYAPFGPVAVPAGQLYVLGDHRNDSYDSRYRGPIPMNAVIGRAFLVAWPPSRLDPIGRRDPAQLD